jgi:hypothetical protein
MYRLIGNALSLLKNLYFNMHLTLSHVFDSNIKRNFTSANHFRLQIKYEKYLHRQKSHVPVC